MIPILKRYRAFLIVLLAVLILTFINKSLGKEIIGITSFSLKEMIQVIPPIFLLLGLLDVWVPKETMTKFMGEGSGLKGILLAMFIGSAAAGPLYGAFPVHPAGRAGSGRGYALSPASAPRPRHGAG